MHVANKPKLWLKEWNLCTRTTLQASGSEGRWHYLYPPHQNLSWVQRSRTSPQRSTLVRLSNYRVGIPAWHSASGMRVFSSDDHLIASRIIDTIYIGTLPASFERLRTTWTDTSQDKDGFSTSQLSLPSQTTDLEFNFLDVQCFIRLAALQLLGWGIMTNLSDFVLVKIANWCVKPNLERSGSGQEIRAG